VCYCRDIDMCWAAEPSERPAYILGSGENVQEAKRLDTKLGHLSSLSGLYTSTHRHYGFPPGVRMAPGFPPNTTWYRSA